MTYMYITYKQYIVKTEFIDLRESDKFLILKVHANKIERNHWKLRKVIQKNF